MPARLQRGEFIYGDPSLALLATAFQPTSSVRPDKEVSSVELNEEVKMWSSVKYTILCSFVLSFISGMHHYECVA